MTEAVNLVCKDKLYYTCIVKLTNLYDRYRLISLDLESKTDEHEMELLKTQ